VRLSAVPVVLLTAVTGSEETDVAFAAGATDYLTKPFGMAHVRARVHEWLQRERSAADSSPSDAGATA
jgi:two-component system KDP operon response regulator KdpE